MKPRRALLILPLMGALALLPACNPSSSNSGGKPNAAKSTSYGSPKEVFDAASAAAAKEDWPTLVQCLTDESRDGLAGTLVMGGMLMKGFAALDKDKGKESAKQIEDVLTKHGLTEEHLKKMDQEPPAKGSDPKDDMKVLAKLIEPIKDKTAFIAEMMTVMKKVADKDTLVSFGNELKDLKIDGDTARGTFLMKQGGKEKQEPIEFRKGSNGWKIQKQFGPKGM
jgi:hypothetical protein